MKYSSKIVLLVIILNVCFTAYIIDLIRDVGNEPSVLITTWFAFTTGELWFLKDIKKKKIDKEQEKEVKENDD